MIENFEYGQAAAVLEDLITRSPDLETEFRARELLVIARASEGSDGRASRAAADLYARDPGYVPTIGDEASPRIRAYFTTAAQDALAAAPVVVQHEERKTGQALQITLSVPTRAVLATAELFARIGTTGAWRRIEGLVRRETQFVGSVELGPQAAATSIVHFYARFVAPSGREAATLGSEDAPIVWRDWGGPPVTPEGPNYWLWGGIGAGVAVAAAGLIYWATLPEEPTMELRIPLP